MKHIAIAPLTALLTTLFTVFCPLSLARAQKQPPPPSWPKLATADEAKLELLVRKLADEDEAVATESEQGIVALGAGAAPLLLRRLGGREAELVAPLSRCLDAIMQLEHVPLLVPLLGRDKVEIRRFATQRLARFHAKEARDGMHKLLADDDATVKLNAALGLAGLGELDQLEPVFVACRDHWREVGPLVTEVLTPIRGKEALRWVTDRMRDGDDQVKVTSLRLMRSVCPKDHAGVIAIQLDSEQHAVKKEAINALRAVVDGAPPLEDLSVFQAIEQAKTWKGRVK